MSKTNFLRGTEQLPGASTTHIDSTLDAESNTNQNSLIKPREHALMQKPAIVVVSDEYSDPSDIEYDTLSEEESEYYDEDEKEQELFVEIDLQHAGKLCEVSRLAGIIFKKAIDEESACAVDKEKILETQKFIKPKHRELVVRWIIQLNYHYKLTSDTLYNAITYLDIFLSKVPIPLEKLQLYAAVCYWISAKIDNRCQPSVSEFSNVSNEKFTVAQFSAAEVQIISALNFVLSYPTSKLFMRRILYLTSNDQLIIEMTNFFTEIALQKWEFVGIPPYTCAISAVFCSCAILGKEEDAFNVVKAVKDFELFVACSNEMLHQGKLAMQKQSNSEKTSELFSHINFDIDISKYINQ